MKLITYSHQDQLYPGAIVEERIVPLTALLHAGEFKRSSPRTLKEFLQQGATALAAAQKGAQRIDVEEAGLRLEQIKLKAPIIDPPKFLCIGMNYRDHCEEQNFPIPETPTLFNKFSTSIIGPDEEVIKPKHTEQLDYEVELAFVIGKTAKRVSEENAMSYVAGYTIVNDISARDWQFGDKQWIRGKCGDTFGPMGPCLVTTDEIPNPHKLDVSLRLNGEVMQSSNTQNLIFSIPYLIAYYSRSITLEIGDVISTGTPGGVGVFRKPPVFLKAGDVMEAGIEGIGVLRNVVSEEG